jgi:putative oxidoreductase
MTQDPKLRGWGFLVLRISVAVMLATFHGSGKLSGAISYIFWNQEWGFPQFVASIGFPFPTFFALCATLAEFIGCVLLALGLFTRYAAGLVAITMSVAVFYHLRTDLGFELAGLYLVSSLFFVLEGPGNISLDQWWASSHSRNVPHHVPQHVRTTGVV